MAVRFLLFLAVFIASGVSNAAAQYCGLNAIAAMAPNFQGKVCDDYLNQVNAAKYPAMAVLWDSSFGNDKTCITRFMDSNRHRPHLVLIYMENGAGRRNGSLESGDFFRDQSVAEWNALLTPTDLEPYRSWHQVVMQAWSDLIVSINTFFNASGNVRTQVVLVPGLESDYTPAVVVALAEFIVRRTWFLVFINQHSSSKVIGAAFGREFHGKAAKCTETACGASLDGQELSASETGKWLAKNLGLYKIAHDEGGQGRPQDKAVFPRRNRHFDYADYWGKVLSNC